MQGTAMAIDRAKLIRIAKILPLLNSDKPGEQQAAAEALASSTCGTLLLCCSLHCHRPPLALSLRREVRQGKFLTSERREFLEQLLKARRHHLGAIDEFVRRHCRNQQPVVRSAARFASMTNV